jgi:hypothetical protein
MAVPAAGGAGEPARADSPCDLTVREVGEPGSRLLVSGADHLAGQAISAEPTAGGPVLVWAPLAEGPARALALPAAGVRGRSGKIGGVLELIEQAQGPLRALRVLRASATMPCCGSALLVEVATDELVLRAALHEPAVDAAEEVRRLRTAYPPRKASDWAVCEWNSRMLDPVDAAGILLLDPHLAAGDSPLVYVLWQDVDGAARAWETFGELADPRLLRAALRDHFRYVDREEELLVVDRSPVSPVGRRGQLTEELVNTATFARPPLPDLETG